MKKVKLNGIITAVIFLLFYHNILPQEVGVSFGVLTNYSPDETSNSAYSFYPEISVSNKFFSQYPNWELAFGYLEDRLDTDEVGSPDKDYNSIDYILSPRLILNSSKIFNYKFVPELIAGFSIHFIKSEFVFHDWPSVAAHIPDEDETRFYFDIGAEHKIVEIWGIGIVPRFITQIPLSNSDLLHNNVKNSFVISVKF